MEVVLKKEKETKNKVRYKEEGDDQVLGVLYVPKSVVEECGLGEKITVKVEVA